MKSAIVAKDNPHANSELPASLGPGERRSHAFFDRAAPAALLPASNDAAFDREQSTTSELAAWAQRASMASGFGEIGASVGAAPFSISRPHQQPARSSRRASLPEILTAMVDAVRDWTRGRIVQWKQNQLQYATYRALDQLDARTLHDIGLDRSELRSVAIELTGASERTRAHAVVHFGSLSS